MAGTSIRDLAGALGVEIDDQDAASASKETALGRLVEVADAFLRTWLHDPDVANVRRLLTIDQHRSAEAGRLWRALTFERPLAFQTDVTAGLTGRGDLEASDPQVVALAFWGR